MADQKKYASWAAKDTREASSLPSDFDGTITAGKFTKEPPDNYNAEGNPIFGVVTIVQDGPADVPVTERTVVQSYSLGAKAGDEFQISDDGLGLIPSGDDIAIRKGSKFDMFKVSLEQNGVSQSVTEAGTFAGLVGIRGHWKRIDDAKLLGKEREFSNDKNKKTSKFPPQTLVMVKLLGAPGDSSVSAPAATSGSVAGSAPAGASVEGDLDTVTFGYLTDVLSASKTKSVQRSQLTLLVSKAAMADARRQDIARRAADEGFIKSLADAGLVTYDPAAKPQVVALAA